MATRQAMQMFKNHVINYYAAIGKTDPDQFPENWYYYFHHGIPMANYCTSTEKKCNKYLTDWFSLFKDNQDSLFMIILLCLSSFSLKSLEGRFYISSTLSFPLSTMSET